MVQDYEIVIITVVDGAGNVLMIRRVDDGRDENAGKWEFPAGHVNPGERPDVTAPREVFEETGLRVYLMPYKVDIPTKKGAAAQYLGTVVGGEVKPEVELAEDEHDAFRWVSVKNLDKIKPTHKNMKDNLRRILEKVNGQIQPQATAHRGRAPMRNSSRGRRQAEQSNPARFVRPLPGPGEDLTEAILVGDEVEIFLKEQAMKSGDPFPDLKGIVDRRNRNMLWLRDEEAKGASDSAGKSIVWKNDGDWAFVRVYRDPDKVIHFVTKGNSYAPDGGKAISDAKGLGLILESEPPDNYESVWALMRGETPDMDMSAGQAPQSMDIVAPFSEPRPGTPPILHQVRQVMRDSGLEPDMVDDLGNGRVLILTKDSTLKKDIVNALKSKGVEIKATRLGGLVVRARNRRMAKGTTTLPIETDDEMMESTIRQRKQKLLRERNRKATGTIPLKTDPANQAGEGLAPQLGITLPSEKKQMEALEKTLGPGVSPKVLPNDMGTHVPINNPQLMQKIQQQMAQNTNMGGQPLARRGERWVRKARQLGRGFREAVADADYPAAGEFLSRLVGMGVSEERIIHSRLASRSGWEGLHHYSLGVGEVGVSRLSRRAARSAPDR